MLWRITSAAMVFGILPGMAATNSGLIQVTNLRAWSHPGSTRVIIETTGPFEYRADHAVNPERLFFDIPHSRPWIAERRVASKTIGDGLVNRVRIAETSPGTTRIVFDLAERATVHVTRLDTPDRMVIELTPETPGAPAPAAITSPPPAPMTYLARIEASSSAATNLTLPPVPYTPVKGREFVYPPRPPLRKITIPTPPLLRADFTLSAVPDTSALLTNIRPPKSAIHTDSTLIIPAAHSATVDAAPLPSANAARSLTRALGLKVNRIVIDAGHGGHDDGTIGPNGVIEKDVVLDVALRLSRLVQDRMGAEVILTRSDDTFIPLHERTAIANERKADLFLSIHANSSPAPEVAGTETFYLNLTASPGAMSVAARENAGADKSVGDLKDLIQSITLNDKVEESQTFAETIQTSIQSQAARSNAAARNRGVKRAPFVVLIGASMPSVLAEIGFLSNARDESNLGKPEYRQKVAEALYKGLFQYSQSLSHFAPPRQSAKAERPGPAGANASQ
jgi:N-acetylmuramoyl-L-alanine amidase